MKTCGIHRDVNSLEKQSLYPVDVAPEDRVAAPSPKLVKTLLASADDFVIALRR
jgi:hypothetical protein